MSPARAPASHRDQAIELGRRVADDCADFELVLDEPKAARNFCQFFREARDRHVLRSFARAFDERCLRLLDQVVGARDIQVTACRLTGKRCVEEIEDAADAP